jgi:division protein CdvB (Snf7/Vps24/ESCRT-III family)
MGNATKHSPTRVSSPARNVQSTINRINARLVQLKKNAKKLQTAHKNLGEMFGNNFYQQNMIQVKMMERHAQEIMREKKMLDRSRQQLIRYQLTHGFPRVG